jgi:hypothetical protein
MLAVAVAVPAAATEEPDRPLLDALAFVPSTGDVVALDFVDWAQLKQIHAATDVTGTSPLRQRQQLLLDIGRAEAAPMPFGFDRTPRWAETWGWDSTDLEWEARVYGQFAVMRFGAHWDARPFREALVGFGYRPVAIEGGAVYHPDPDAEVPWQQRFANMHGLHIHGPGITEPMVHVAVTADGRTALFGRESDAGMRLRGALEADPALVAASGFGRAAAALGRPLAASLDAGHDACSKHTVEHLESYARAAAMAVAPLHRYDALGTGYSRADRSAPPVGRFVFVYPRAEQAEDDLAGRRTLVEEGYAFNDEVRRYEDAAFSLSDARVLDSRLILDVDPIGGAPVHVMRHTMLWPILFATCGPAPAAA